MSREQFQDMDLMLFEQVACFDNYRQKILLIANADADNLDESYRTYEITPEQFGLGRKVKTRGIGEHSVVFILFPLTSQLLCSFAPLL